MRKSTRDSEKGKGKANCFLLKFHSKDKKRENGTDSQERMTGNINTHRYYQFFFLITKYMEDFGQKS